MHPTPKHSNHEDLENKSQGIRGHFRQFLGIAPKIKRRNSRRLQRKRDQKSKDNQQSSTRRQIMTRDDELYLNSGHTIFAANRYRGNSIGSNDKRNSWAHPLSGRSSTEIPFLRYQRQKPKTSLPDLLKVAARDAKNSPYLDSQLLAPYDDDQASTSTDGEAAPIPIRSPSSSSNSTDSTLLTQHMPIKHAVITTPTTSYHYVPSSISPLNVLSWSPSPRIKGRYRTGSLSYKRELEMTIDTGAEKCLILKSSIPPSAVISDVAPHHVAGIGGPHVVRQQAVFELQIAGTDELSGGEVEITINVVADVTEEFLGCMGSSDVLLGCPTLLPLSTEIHMGTRTPGSAKAVFTAPCGVAKLPIKRLSEYGCGQPAITPRNSQGFMPFPHASAVGYCGNPARYSGSVDHDRHESRRVVVPLTFSNTYSTGGAPFLLGDWYCPKQGTMPYLDV